MMCSVTMVKTMTSLAAQPRHIQFCHNEFTYYPMARHAIGQA
jgi:hypothetical protein